MKRSFFLLIALVFSACAPTQAPQTPAQDQSAQAVSAAPTQSSAARTPIRTQVVTLRAPLRQTLPVTVILPSKKRSALPIILFSTGAFSSPEKYTALLNAWAQHGYGVLAPLHVDSEAWTGTKPADQRAGLAWRMNDLRVVVDSLDQLEAATGADFDEARVAATGHSFGALVAQILGGAQVGPVGGDIGALPAVPISAIIAISPPGSIPNYIDASGWANMQAPQFLTTGDKDVVPMMAPEWQAHLAGHQAHPGPSWALAQAGVDHYFGNVIGRTEYPGPPAQAQFKEMVTQSLIFLDAFLAGNRQAAEAMGRVPQIPSGEVSYTRR